ncbi:MAG TPA: hypothetical protein DEA82_02965, partial [Flavobacteriaceae bacterium]|nr:hypothetical protein [Flavobacteriaceae bacterium]
MNKLLCFLLFCTVTVGVAQETNTNYRTKKVAVRDTIRVDTVSINPRRFELLDASGKKIDSTSYTIDFKTGTLLLLENFDPTDSITINYLKYPQFLTRDYFTFDPKLIIE